MNLPLTCTRRVVPLVSVYFDTLYGLEVSAILRSPHTQSMHSAMILPVFTIPVWNGFICLWMTLYLVFTD